MYGAKVLADSISDHDIRLVTMELTYPRFVHAEFMTHRVFSRNAASSRAIPVEKLIRRVVDDPVIPVYWGKNQKGMQASEELDGGARGDAEAIWLAARDDAVENAYDLLNKGVHKQLVNRLIEPWMWITVIVTGTEWGNFFNLRCHPAAQPELRVIAEMARDLYYSSVPMILNVGEWHLPLMPDLDALQEKYRHGDLCRISVGRCARVSYLTHDGVRDPQADIDLHDRLMADGHWSPFEHVATPNGTTWSGNLRGWWQYRKGFEAESPGPTESR